MSYHPLIRHTVVAALLSALALPASAGTTVLNFDSLPAGSAANADSATLAGGIRFDHAYFGAPMDANGDPILDGNGDPITTQAWRIDPTVTDPVAVEDTNIQGWGAAPSSPNALDARFSPVLLHFTGPVNLSGFSFTLPDSNLGALGISQVDFLDSAGQILGSLGFNEGNPLALVSLSTGPLLGVKDVVLASGTFYDNITLTTAVPAPATLSLMLAGLAGFFPRRKTA